MGSKKDRKGAGHVENLEDRIREIYQHYSLVSEFREMCDMHGEHAVDPIFPKNIDAAIVAYVQGKIEGGNPTFEELQEHVCKWVEDHLYLESPEYLYKVIATCKECQAILSSDVPEELLKALRGDMPWEDEEFPNWVRGWKEEYGHSPTEYVEDVKTSSRKIPVEKSREQTLQRIEENKSESHKDIPSEFFEMAFPSLYHEKDTPSGAFAGYKALRIREQIERAKIPEEIQDQAFSVLALTSCVTQDTGEVILPNLLSRIKALTSLEAGIEKARKLLDTLLVGYLNVVLQHVRESSGHYEKQLPFDQLLLSELGDRVGRLERALNLPKWEGKSPNLEEILKSLLERKLSDND